MGSRYTAWGLMGGTIFGSRVLQVSATVLKVGRQKVCGKGRRKEGAGSMADLQFMSGSPVSRWSNAKPQRLTQADHLGLPKGGPITWGGRKRHMTPEGQGYAGVMLKVRGKSGEKMLS